MGLNLPQKTTAKLVKTWDSCFQELSNSHSRAVILVEKGRTWGEPHNLPAFCHTIFSYCTAGRREPKWVCGVIRLRTGVLLLKWLESVRLHTREEGSAQRGIPRSLCGDSVQYLASGWAACELCRTPQGLVTTTWCEAKSWPVVPVVMKCWGLLDLDLAEHLGHFIDTPGEPLHKSKDHLA